MKRIFAFLVLCTLLLGGGNAFASGLMHYLPGAEGIKAPVMPPEGFYMKWYAGYQHLGTSRDNNGKYAGDHHPHYDTFLLLHRFIWSTGIKVLGADLVTGVVVPLPQSTTVSTYGSGGRSDSSFNLGDIELNPFLLGWHFDKWDLLFGTSVYIPTGQYTVTEHNGNYGYSAHNTGTGFWTFMFTPGFTFYFDDEKSWSLSALFRYELPTRQAHTNVVPGQFFHTEWALAKKINEYFEIGITGAHSFQLTRQTKLNRGDPNDQFRRTNAIGPEVIFNIPDWGASVGLRAQWDYESRNAGEGNLIMLNFTKAF